MQLFAGSAQSWSSAVWRDLDGGRSLKIYIYLYSKCVGFWFSISTFRCQTNRVEIPKFEIFRMHLFGVKMTTHNVVLLQDKKRRNLRHNSTNSSKSLQVDCLRSHNVVALYYNGIDLTSTLTGDLPLGPVDFLFEWCHWHVKLEWMRCCFGASTPRLDFNSPKTFQFYHVQEAYLAITVRGSVGSFAPQLGLKEQLEAKDRRCESSMKFRCGTDAFYIICSNGEWSPRITQPSHGKSMTLSWLSVIITLM